MDHILCAAQATLTAARDTMLAVSLPFVSRQKHSHLFALLEAKVCQKAVEVARAQQPDYEAHWAKAREQQRPR